MCDGVAVLWRGGGDVKEGGGRRGAAGVTAAAGVITKWCDGTNRLREGLRKKLTYAIPSHRHPT